MTSWKEHIHIGLLFLVVALCVGITSQILKASLGTPLTVSRDGSTNFFVQSGFAETDSSLASLTLRRVPSEGNVLVAVVASGGSEPAGEQEGWTRIVASQGSTPAQAIYYRVVGEEESQEIAWTGLKQRERHVLSIYEYRFIDVASGPVAFASTFGEGKVASIRPTHEPAERLLEFTAVALNGRKHVYALSPEGFFPRRNIEPNGDGGVTVAVGDRLSAFGDIDPHRADVNQSADWTMQTIAFRTNRSVDAAQVTAASGGLQMVLDTEVDNVEPQEGDTITFTVSVKNEAPTALANSSFLVRLPKYVALRSVDATAGTYAPRGGSWTIPQLPVGGTATLTIEADASAGSAAATFFFRAALETYDGMLEGVALPWDATRVQVKAHPRLPEDFACPEVTGTSVKVKSFAAGNIASLTLTASNATYVLLNDTPDILTAVAYPYVPSFQYAAGPDTDGTVYAWFGNSCDQAQVVSSEDKDD